VLECEDMGWEKEELLYEYNSESQTCKEINGSTRNKCLVGSLYQTCFLFFLWSTLSCSHLAYKSMYSRFLYHFLPHGHKTRQKSQDKEGIIAEG
jgi:hypothetical protein